MAKPQFKHEELEHSPFIYDQTYISRENWFIHMTQSSLYSNMPIRLIKRWEK